MATLWYSHFDSTPEDTRLLLAEDWAKYIRNFLGDGIKDGGTNLRITADGAGMHTYLDNGYANIQGYFFKCEEDFETKQYKIDHPSSHPTQARIDRIVLRLDRTIAARNILPVVLIGEPGSEQPPEITRNSNIWEISLAQVRVQQGATIIYPENITDERLDSSVCGIIDSLISADTEGMYQDFRDQFNAVITGLNREVLELIEEKQQLFEKQRETIQQWYDSVKVDISKLQTFNFDNLPELPGADRNTEFKEDGSIYEVIKKSSGDFIAERTTEFLDSGDIVEKNVLYDEDGETVLKECTVTTRFLDDGSIQEVVH